MVSFDKVLFLFLLLLISFPAFCRSHSGFPSDFLGNYVSDEEYNNRSFCRTLVCMKDSDRLLYNADRDSEKTNPCDDFKTFAMGDFYELRVPNDRYGDVSFNNDASRQDYERQKRMLLKPIAENKPKMFKVMKTFFRQCSDFRLAENQGSFEVLNHAQKLGIVPTSSENNEKSLPFKNTMIFLPQTMRIFFDHFVGFCPCGSEDVLCLRHLDRYKYSEILAFEKLETLKNLKVDENYKKQIVSDYVSFMILKKKIQEHSTDEKWELFTIRELYEKFPSTHLDWLPMINSWLLEDLKKTLDDKILIKKPQLFEGLYKIFVRLEESFLKNVLATEFFSWNEDVFTTQRFLTLEDIKKEGQKRPVQRFELCVNDISQIMGPALEALTAVTFRDKLVQKSATEFVELAVSDTIERISKLNDDEIVPQKIKDLMVEKLKLIKLWVFFPEEIFNITEIGKFYDELDFEGTETLVELKEKMMNHNEKMWARPKNDWIKILQKIIDSRKKAVHYHTDINVLYVRMIWSFYPLFHPNRPRFFNMATLYVQVILQIRDGLRKKIPNFDLTQLLNYWWMADQSYVKWEANGGVDLQLPAFKLTNRQMLWVSLLNTNAQKFVSNPLTTVNDAWIYRNKNANLIFKSYDEFREAFRCGNWTSLDEEKQKEYRKGLRAAEANASKKSS